MNGDWLSAVFLQLIAGVEILAASCMRVPSINSEESPLFDKDKINCCFCNFDWLFYIQNRRCFTVFLLCFPRVLCIEALV